MVKKIKANTDKKFSAITKELKEAIGFSLAKGSIKNDQKNMEIVTSTIQISITLR
ncbi:MAG: hypothetical protein PHQ17_04350 [Methanobacterium sp.]|jgi:hypothetical protein|nr:hypothetical protein [Methanobacterium sp.]